MKNLLAAILLFCAIYGYGQTKYESPYVTQGKSYSFEVPESIEERGATRKGIVHSTVYSRFDGTEIISETSPVVNLGDQIQFMLLHNSDNRSPEEFLEIMRATNEKSDITVEVEKYTTASGFEFMTSITNTITDDVAGTMYLAGKVYKDVIIMCTILDVDDGHELDKSLVQSVLDSFKEYETDRENTFDY